VLGLSSTRPAADEPLLRVQLAGFEQSHQKEGLQRGSQGVQTKSGQIHSMSGQDGSSWHVDDDKSARQFSQDEIHFAP
jgi:hypothetical protein